MSRGTSAVRSSFTVRPPEESQLSVDPDELRQATGEEDLDREGLARLKEIAVLKDHPGWKNIQELMEKTVSSYRSGNIMSRKSTDVAQMSDAEFGQRMRVCLAVADELDAVVAIVQNAAQAVEGQKRSGRKQGA